MTKLYDVPVSIAATMYVKANSLREAIKLANQEVGDAIFLDKTDDRVSSAEFDDPNLPDISFSPACSILSIVEDDVVEVEI